MMRFSKIKSLLFCLRCIGIFRIFFREPQVRSERVNRSVANVCGLECFSRIFMFRYCGVVAMVAILSGLHANSVADDLHSTRRPRAGTQQDVPELITPAEIIVGDPPAIRAENLTAGSAYELRAEMIDSIGRRWYSVSQFTADHQGVIKFSTALPTGGDYLTRDAYGPLWSMRLHVEQDQTIQSPRDFNEISYQLVQEERVVAEATTRQWIIPPGLESEKLDNELVAEVFFDPNVKGPRAGILLLGGSGGGLSWARRQAALLAKEGHIAMALAYFNAEGLQKHLAQVPLEYVDKALEHLIQHPGSDRKRIGIVGYSKGAELALVTASRHPEITAVVAYAPGSAVFQGFKPPSYPVISSWTEGGKDLAFVPNAYDKHFFQSRDGMYLWYRTLQQYEEVEKAAIRVENIEGKILLLSGARDGIWPATLMGERIVSRLHVPGKKGQCEHVVFGEAGHGIAAPPGEPTTRVAERLGGTASGNAKARQTGWDKVAKFLEENLREGK